MSKKKKLPPPVDVAGEPVMTTNYLAQFYKTTPENITQNFRRNQDRFVEGKHYFKLEGDELKKFQENCTVHSEDFSEGGVRRSNNIELIFRNATNNLEISPMTRAMYLWTERGAFYHAKILNTDPAWEVYDMLVECYYAAKSYSHHKERQKSKNVNDIFNATVKRFAEYAIASGSSRKNPVIFYSQFAKKINEAVGLKKNKDRDNATVAQLYELQGVMIYIDKVLNVGIDNSTPYKQIEATVDGWLVSFKNPMTLINAAVNAPILPSV